MERDPVAVYCERGFDSREDYLKALADEYEIPYEDVVYMADVLGEDEDFDELPKALDHCADWWTELVEGT